MNIYEYVKERGFELTGEYRKALPGEWFLSPSGPMPRMGPEPSSGSYPILKKLCDSFEFDGQIFRLPEGYELVRVGVPKMSDVDAGYRITADLVNGCVVSEIYESTVRVCGGGPFFILKKKE